MQFERSAGDEAMMANHTAESAHMRVEVDALTKRLALLEADAKESPPPHSRIPSARGRPVRNVSMLLTVVAVLAVFAGASIVYGQDAVQALFINAEGNVGIGTVDPHTELEVAGTILAESMSTTGIVQADSIIVTGGVSATVFNGNGTIPVGGVIMWSGAVESIPAGWALCNGQTVNGQLTPNLVDRFVIAAGNLYSPTVIGGSTNATLSADNLPPFDVTWETHLNGMAHSLDGSQSFFAMTGLAVTAGMTQDFPNTPLGILPPYYALAYIMRVE